MKAILLSVAFLLGLYSFSMAQYTTLNAHSHNDYEQKNPFFLAWQNHFGSIEADIWEVNGELLVAHTKNELSPDKTLDALYLNPIVKIFKMNNGSPWSKYSGTFQLLIDIKTSVEPALTMLVEKLKMYPEVFNPQINKHAVRVVITGNRPNPEDFSKYPGFIFYDGKFDLRYSSGELKKIALYSENLTKFTSWKGEGKIPDTEYSQLKNVIDSVHSLKKKVRFWNAPDNPDAWKILTGLKVDYINTDHIKELAAFLNSHD